MYQQCRMLVPVLHACRRAPPVRVQSARNLWEVMRPLDVRSVFRDMERQMENFERSFFRNNPLRIITPRAMPIEGKVDSNNSNYRVNIDVQGFKPEDIKISLKEGLLKIEAHMDKTAEDGSRFQQSIVREFTLPSNVEQSTVKSLLHEDGILSIEASLNKLDEPKDIPVQHIESEKPKSKM